MSQVYNCNICRSYPCSCGTSTNFKSDTTKWINEVQPMREEHDKEISKWRGLCSELLSGVITHYAKLNWGDPYKDELKDLINKTTAELTGGWKTDPSLWPSEDALKNKAKGKISEYEKGKEK